MMFVYTDWITSMCIQTKQAETTQLTLSDDTLSENR